MNELHQPLLELQELDAQIKEAENRIAAFEPQLAQIEAPAAALEKDVEGTRATLTHAQTESRRLERAAEEKRERLRRYQERLEKVRNVREETAARTEIDLVRRAVEADEQEALEYMEQGRKVSLKLSELEKRLEAARAEVEPRRAELMTARAEVESERDILRDKRGNHAQRIPQPSLRTYERVRAGRPKPLMPMTASGACGNCYNTLPIQEQEQVRRGDALRACEACGVILYAPE